LSEEEMSNTAKETKGVGKALINGIGFLTYLFGSLILLAIAFGAIGGMFMSTKRLFEIKRVKKDEDDGRSKPGGQTTPQGMLNLVSPAGKQKKVD